MTESKYRFYCQRPVCKDLSYENVTWIGVQEKNRFVKETERPARFKVRSYNLHPDQFEGFTQASWWLSDQMHAHCRVDQNEKFHPLKWNISSGFLQNFLGHFLLILFTFFHCSNFVGRICMKWEKWKEQWTTGAGEQRSECSLTFPIQLPLWVDFEN